MTHIEKDTGLLDWCSNYDCKNIRIHAGDHIHNTNFLRNLQMGRIN